MLRLNVKYSNLEVMEHLNYYVDRSHKDYLKSRLTKLGYEYTCYRGGFIFTKVPAEIKELTTEEEKQDSYESVVKDFVVREVGKKNINDYLIDYAINFALFYIDLGEEIDYNRSTYKQKKQMIEDVLGRPTVKESTLGTWTRDLMKKNILVKTMDKDLFCTYWVDRQKVQLNVDTCMNKDLRESCINQYKLYSKDRSILLKEYNGNWTKVTEILLHKYNCIYYKVPAIFMNIHFMGDDWLNFLDACSFWLFKSIDAKTEKEQKELEEAEKIRQETIKAREEEKKRIQKEIKEQAENQKVIEITIRSPKKNKVKSPFEQLNISEEQRKKDIETIENMMRELETKKQILLNS